MICDNILSIHRRIRVARLSTLGGECKLARHLMTSAGRDLAQVKAEGATTRNACARELAKGTSEFLAESRRLIREQCGLARGDR
jgi:hypothetical protein